MSKTKEEVIYLGKGCLGGGSLLMGRLESFWFAVEDEGNDREHAPFSSPSSSEIFISLSSRPTLSCKYRDPLNMSTASY
ncbi:unnamed protein product [Ilex paraguariensis]|uniref:Uncharacterized protein n=1 Tax=Ilex paraguariensis TaxID=185542 RepID=A0ABC8TMG4_9AQUA